MAILSWFQYFLIMWVVLFASNVVILRTTAQNQDCNPQGRQIPLFVFGDSLFDVGNNNYLKNPVGRANYFPYGETFFKYPTGRASNGRNLVDFIAQYLNLPVLLPYLLPGYHQFTDGVNFASGGAGALVETFRGLVVDLNTQLRYFKNVETKLIESIGDTETRSLLNKALFIFSVGGNDYTASMGTNSTFMPSFPKEEYVDMVMGNITTVLRELYKSGGRKVGFLNLFPLGCTPILRARMNRTGDDCVEEANEYIKMHNIALPKVLAKLHTQLDGFDYSIFDMYATLGDRMQNPSKYGLSMGMKMGCCGSGPHRGILNCGNGIYELCETPSEYVFWDSIHPTEKTCQQLGQLMWSGSSDVASPVNLKSLVQF